MTMGAGLMPTFETLSTHSMAVVRAMSDAAREALRDAGIKPRNDDAAARFDEACAVFLVVSMNRMELNE
jgi:hypothetical protein